MLSSTINGTKMSDPLEIAILGGTGHEGSGLARRWARAGHRIILGSRDSARAVTAAGVINELLGCDNVSGMSNVEAASKAQVVMLTVPYAAQRATVEEVRDALEGKILIDATVPLVPPKVSRVQLPEGGSAVAAIQDLLGDKVRVVSAFQNVSAHQLADLDHAVECDVLICGNDEAAREVAVRLAADAGARGIHAGPIANSVVSEALTSVLIAINRRYKMPAAGIRITGV
jgi:8-hydroxy-5-deazaflavin:NADPH oxidoreductase